MVAASKPQLVPLAGSFIQVRMPGYSSEHHGKDKIAELRKDAPRIRGADVKQKNCPQNFKGEKDQLF
jgi:hypothetical protein